MGTVAIKPTGTIAVVAEDAEALGVSVSPKPAIRALPGSVPGMTAKDLTTMCVASAVDMIDGEKFIGRFSAAGARSSVRIEHGFSQAAALYGGNTAHALRILAPPLGHVSSALFTLSRIAARSCSRTARTIALALHPFGVAAAACFRLSARCSSALQQVRTSGDFFAIACGGLQVTVRCPDLAARSAADHTRIARQRKWRSAIQAVGGSRGHPSHNIITQLSIPHSAHGQRLVIGGCR